MVLEMQLHFQDPHILALYKAEEMIIFMSGILSHMEIEIASDSPHITDLILV